MNILNSGILLLYLPSIRIELEIGKINVFIWPKDLYDSQSPMKKDVFMPRQLAYVYIDLACFNGNLSSRVLKAIYTIQCKSFVYILTSSAIKDK
jgi:hypothetical protein